MVGGLTTNFIWCALLNLKKKSGYQYFASYVWPEHAHHGGSTGSAVQSAALVATAPADLKIPVLANYLFSALAGTPWYFQFFFYSMGETQMGKYRFASSTLHMASIIIFSAMRGWILHEWNGSSKKAHLLIACGLGTLILSTIVIGFWNIFEEQDLSWEGLGARIRCMEIDEKAEAWGERVNCHSAAPPNKRGRATPKGPIALAFCGPNQRIS
jgi:L-rhamnose-H+ transport protein